MLVFHHTDNVTADANPTAGWSKPLGKQTDRQESRAGHGAPVNAPQPDAAGHPRRRGSDRERGMPIHDFAAPDSDGHSDTRHVSAREQDAYRFHVAAKRSRAINTSDQSPIRRYVSRKGSSISPSMNISPIHLWVCPSSEIYRMALPVISFPSPVLPMIL